LIDLADDDDVDLSARYIIQQSLKRRTARIAARETAIVIFGPGASSVFKIVGAFRIRSHAG
jgi:hypothetical protein